MRGTLGDATLEWLEFVDPSDPQRKFRVNATFMLSAYTCIFGSGCHGLLNNDKSSNPYGRGCCERGVTFVSEDDFNHVSKMVDQLTEEDCDKIDYVRDKGWHVRAPSGVPYKTRKVDGACVFANLPDGRTGKAGCSFHVMALRTGRAPEDCKPDVCWTVPIAYEEVEDFKRDQVIAVISAFDASSWGGSSEEVDGEEYMGYWCIDTPDAYVGAEPLYKSHETTLRKMMGDSGYEQLRALLDTRKRTTVMPGEVRNEGRPLIPLLVKQFEERNSG